MQNLCAAGAFALKASAIDNVLIIDFGGQTAQLITRRIREAGVSSEAVPFTKAAEGIAWLAPKAIILSGGPAERDGAGFAGRARSDFHGGRAGVRHLLRPADRRTGSATVYPRLDGARHGFINASLLE